MSTYIIHRKNGRSTLILGGVKISLHVRERDVESRLTSSLERIGVPCIKFSPEHKVGMPDRLILLPGGKCIWVELKTQGGHLAEIQKLQHRRLVDAGQRVEVLWNKKDVDNLVAEVKREISIPRVNQYPLLLDMILLNAASA